MPVLSRRRLLGAAAGVAALAAGATAGWLSVVDQHRALPPDVQRHADVLQAALELELALLDQLAASAVATPLLATRAAVLRADHGAHRDAIAGLIRSAGATPTLSAPAIIPGASGSASSSGPATAPSLPVPLRTIAELIRAERANQAAAGASSANLTGTAAAVLASISACEATHVAWLG